MIFNADKIRENVMHYANDCRGIIKLKKSCQSYCSKAVVIVDSTAPAIMAWWPA